MCVLLFVSFSDDCAEGFRPATCNVPPRSIVSQRSQTQRCSLISCETLFWVDFITRMLEILLHSALEALGRHYLFSWQSPHLHLNFERLASKTSRTPITRLSQAPVGRAGRGDVWTMLPPSATTGERDADLHVIIHTLRSYSDPRAFVDLGLPAAPRWKC